MPLNRLLSIIALLTATVGCNDSTNAEQCDDDSDCLRAEAEIAAADPTTWTEEGFGFLSRRCVSTLVSGHVR